MTGPRVVTSELIKSRARRLLDEVRLGIGHSLQSINWALRALGEPV